MLCNDCQNLVGQSTYRRARRSGRWAPPQNALAGLVCKRCGAVLQAEDSAEWILTRLSRLSRFGLGADDRPILATRGGR